MVKYTCTCGGRLFVAEGITGYYPTVPHKCDKCGTVVYVRANQSATTSRKH